MSRFVIIGLLAGAIAVPVARAADDCDAQCVQRLRTKLELYRKARAQHEQWDPFRASLDHAQQLETEGLQQLPSKRDLLNAGKEIWDVGAAHLGRKLTLANARDTPADFAARQELMAKMFKAPGDIVQKSYEAGETLFAMNQPGPRNASALDQEIARYENWRKLAKGAAAWDVKGNLSPYDKVADVVISGPLIRAYLERAGRATSDTERNLYREKAGKEVIKMLAAVGGPGIETEVKLIQANAEIWTRLAYWGGAYYAASGERDRATQVRNDAISALTQRILVTQWEIDRAERNEKIRANRAGLPATREPGGIKIGGIAADVLAAKMDLTGIAFDPVRGRMVLTGGESGQAVDLSIFADVLRLAVEKHDPFFSLSPVTREEWDQRSTFVSERLVEKYFRQAGGPDAFAARLRAVGTRLPLKGDRDCFYATARDFDSALYREMTGRLDARQERVYSPEWLAYSKVGQILYEADLAIKAIAAGMIHVESEIAPSLAAVWEIPDFTPMWAMPDELQGEDAGRANFEIDSSTVAVHGRFLDLSDVKPKLVMVRRKAGTSDDLPPGPLDKKAAAHFDQHWKAYAAAVPAIAELATVFRAYVAARHLVRQRGSEGLVQRILAMSPPPGAPGIALYNVRAPAIFACQRAGRLVPILEGSKRWFHVGGGFGGGITLRAVDKEGKAKVTIDHRAAPSEASLFASAAALGPAGYHEEAGQKALVLDLDTISVVPEKVQLALWGGCLLLFALVGGVAGYVALRRRGRMAVHACAHCTRVYRVLEPLAGAADVAALATLAFLATLPFLAAAWESESLDSRLFIAVAAVVSSVLLAGAAAWGLREFVSGRLGWSGAWGGVFRHAGAGARWLGLLLGLALVSGGFSERAVGDRFLLLAGSGIGERVMAFLGSAETLRWAALVLLAAALFSAVLRWWLPFAFGSRPLPLGAKAHGHGR